jgi:hypothetical protein
MSKWYVLKGNSTIVAEPLCKPRRADAITIDATASYMAQANPEAIKLALPSARVLMLIRAPLQRAWSHYLMHGRFKRKVASFDKKLVREMNKFNQKRSTGRVMLVTI